VLFPRGMAPSFVFVPRLFVYPLCVRSLCTPCVSCASPHALPSALSHAFPYFKAVKKKNSVFSLIVAGGCVSSFLVHSQQVFFFFFLWARLSTTPCSLLMVPCISPRVFLKYSLCVFSAVCSAIRHPVHAPLGYWTFSMLSLFPKQLVCYNFNLYYLCILSCSGRTEWDRRG